MKKFLSVLVLLFTATAYAGVQGYSNVTSLGVFNKIQCSTGMTCTKVGETFKMVSSPTLSGNLTLSAAEAADLVFSLWADEGDDAADKFSLTSTATNTLVLKNSTTALLTFSSAGVMTLADSEVFTNSGDVVTFAFDDAAANVKVAGFEATKASLTLQADESDDNADDWQLTSEVANTFTIANDTSGAQVAKFTMAASDGDITLTGGITGDGGDTVSGFLQSQVASTTVAITAAQCGSTFVSNSADVMTLPEASTVLGCRVTFVCGTADDFDINPADGTDVIGITGSITGANTTTVLAPAGGDALRCTDIGAGFTIEAVGNDLWAVLSANGIITDVN